jgi:hypothetical protein
MADKYYKVWMHLEEITKDDDGKDVEYLSLEEETLPITFGSFASKDKAIEVMNQYHYLFMEVK